ncbi:MAG TPA: hypothetical protein VGC32_08880 [Solirubrobacterales bacterium]
MLVVETIAAPPRPSRRRRRPRDSEAAAPPAEVPLARATAIRAFEPFEREEEAAAWLAAATAEEAGIDVLVDTGIALVNDALHAHALAAVDPATHAVAPERAVVVRIGWGSGGETAAGAYSEALEIDVTVGVSRRRRRTEDMRPQERVAALLRGRERAALCEVLLLRARSDLDAGRRREAALQLRIGIDALRAELPDALDDDDHREDIQSLEARQETVEVAAAAALVGELDSDSESVVRESLEIAERVLRRRRVLEN